MTVCLNVLFIHNRAICPYARLHLSLMSSALIRLWIISEVYVDYVFQTGLLKGNGKYRESPGSFFKIRLSYIKPASCRNTLFVFPLLFQATNACTDQQGNSVGYSLTVSIKQRWLFSYL